MNFSLLCCKTASQATSSGRTSDSHAGIFLDYRKICGQAVSAAVWGGGRSLEWAVLLMSRRHSLTRSPGAGLGLGLALQLIEPCSERTVKEHSAVSSLLYFCNLFADLAHARHIEDQPRKRYLCKCVSIGPLVSLAIFVFFL